MAKKPPNLFNFWNELKRRKVVKAVFVYVAVAWAILEAADTIFPALGLPEWTVKFVLILLVIVFILVIVLTWIYDITPEGIKVTQDLVKKTEEEKEESAKEDEKPKTGKSSERGTDENELQKKVVALEDQLKEARRASLKSLRPVIFKKIVVPLFIAVLVLVLVFNKQKIVEIMGFGNAKREISRTHVQNALPYIDRNDFEAANREIELALESDPGYSFAWSSLAAISVKQGDLNKAIVQTIKAVELDPSNGSAAYNLAYALEDKNDFHQAVEWYSKAIKADSALLPAYSALGRLYNILNQPVDAILILTLAKNKYADSDTIYLIYKNLGNSYFLQGLQDSAMKYLELSYSLNSSEPETNLFLARAYEAAGDLNRAIVQWQNYINLETDTAKIDAAVKHRKELAVRQLEEIIR
jgi:tetratricopeptide (TPR) repeat protein